MTDHKEHIMSRIRRFQQKWLYKLSCRRALWTTSTYDVEQKIIKQAKKQQQTKMKSFFPSS
jgi:hypothetical protein